MKRLMIAALAALIVPLAVPAGEDKQSSGNEQSTEKTSAEGSKTSSDGERDPTYGQYSTDPGTEARSEAKQSSSQDQKSKAPQDERAYEPSKAKKGEGEQTSVAEQPPSVVDNARRDEARIEGDTSSSGGASSGEDRNTSVGGEKR
jgi:hypothetical protein